MDQRYRWGRTHAPAAEQSSLKLRSGAPAAEARRRRGWHRRRPAPIAWRGRARRSRLPVGSTLRSGSSRGRSGPALAPASSPSRQRYAARSPCCRLAPEPHTPPRVRRRPVQAGPREQRCQLGLSTPGRRQPVACSGILLAMTPGTLRARAVPRGSNPPAERGAASPAAPRPSA